MAEGEEGNGRRDLEHLERRVAIDPRIYYALLAGVLVVILVIVLFT